MGTIKISTKNLTTLRLFWIRVIFVSIVFQGLSYGVVYGVVLPEKAREIGLNNEHIKFNEPIDLEICRFGGAGGIDSNPDWNTFLIEHGYIEKDRKENIFGQKSYKVTDKLRTFIVSEYELRLQSNYCWVIKVAKYRLKSIDKVEKSRIGDDELWRFSFTFWVEPLLPGLPTLGPYKGYSAVRFNRWREKWSVDINEIRFLEGSSAIGEYGKWLKENFQRRVPSQQKHSAVHEKFPTPRGAVNDFAKIIDLPYVAQMENLARGVLDKTGTAVVVVTMESIGNDNINDYANRLYNAWGIGKKGEDKGVLIFLALKERTVRIETGYGVEGILPDELVGQILDQRVIPYLKEGDYGRGLNNAVVAVSEIIAKNANVSLSGHPAVRQPIQALSEKSRNEKKGKKISSGNKSQKLTETLH